MNGIQISILVIDDDPICLKVVTKYLERLNHHVIGISDPIDALGALQANYEAFDLILTDVHMPQLNGIDLLKRVTQKFQLPVVLMSADCDKNVMLKGLEDGASFYLIKPITIDSLQKLWQFTVSRMKPANDVSSIQQFMKPANDMSSIQQFYINTDQNNDNKFEPMLTSFDRQYEERANENITLVKNTNKKPKLTWTTALHNQFLEAVNKMGIKQAVPKKILEYMNVPGLRRENVASHLQKYRIFLKRISEMSNSSENGILNNGNERPLRSSFVLNEITYLTSNLHQQYQEILSGKQIGQIKSLGCLPGDINPKYKKIIESVSDDMSYPDKETIHRSNDLINYVDSSFRGYQADVSTNFNTNSHINNYVGLRITNGELVDAHNDSSASFMHGGNNSLYGISNKQVNFQRQDVNSTYLNISQNPQSPLFGMNNNNQNVVGANNHINFGSNANLYMPSFNQEVEQKTFFDNPQEVQNREMNNEITPLDISAQYNQQQESTTFGNDFTFESFDLPDYGVESFEGIDQGLLLNDDISFENYYAQEFGQQNCGNFNHDNFTKDN